MTFRQSAIAMVGVALLVIAASAQTVEGSFERTLNVSGPADLKVETGSGAIEVSQGSAGQVRVRAEIRARERLRGMSAEQKVRAIEANPPIQQTGNRIVIGRIEDRELRDNVSIRYFITAPVDTTLDASTGSGSVSVSGLQSPARVNTGSGEIHLANMGEVTARTGSGGMRLEDVKGPVRAETGSGGIQISGASQSVRASTGSGGIEVSGASIGRAELETGSGSIRVRNVRGGLRASTGSGNVTVEGEATDAWSINTGSGDVSLTMPSESAFALDIRSSSGSIDVAHPVTVQGSVGRRTLRGSVRGGGTLVAVETGSGSVRIR